MKIISEIENTEIIKVEDAQSMGIRLVFGGGDSHAGLFFNVAKIIRNGSEVSLVRSVEDFKSNNLKIENLQVKSAIIADNGELTISMVNGVSLVCSPDDKVEAWEFRWNNGKTIVSLPGGGYSEF